MTLQWAHFHWLIWEHKRHKAGGQVSNSIPPTPSILIVHFQCYPRLYRHTRLLSSLSVQVFIRRDNKSDCSSHRSEILQMFSSESDSPSIRTLSRDFSLPDNVNDGFGGLPFRFGPDSRQTLRIGFPIRFYIDDSFQWLFREGEEENLRIRKVRRRIQRTRRSWWSCKERVSEKNRPFGSLSDAKGASQPTSQTIHGFIIM